jgi:hypothetical protein
LRTKSPTWFIRQKIPDRKEEIKRKERKEGKGGKICTKGKGIKLRNYVEKV